MSAAVKIEVNADPFAAMRALNKMPPGFAFEVAHGAALMVEPASRLSDPQRAYIRAHRPALLALLHPATNFMRR